MCEVEKERKRRGIASTCFSVDVCIRGNNSDDRVQTNTSNGAHRQIDGVRERRREVVYVRVIRCLAFE